MPGHPHWPAPGYTATAPSDGDSDPWYNQALEPNWQCKDMKSKRLSLKSVYSKRVHDMKVSLSLSFSLTHTSISIVVFILWL